MEELKPTLDDLVFEDRNKEYGAFFLRKVYPVHLKVAVAIVFSLLVLSLGGPFAYIKYFLVEEKGVKTKEVEVDLSTIEIPPLDPSLPPPPPPPPMEQPKVNTVMHVPPKVVPDKEIKVEVLPPTQKEMENSAIGNKNEKGESNADLNPMPSSENNSGLFGNGEEDNSIFMPSAGLHAQFPGGQEALAKYLYKHLEKTKQKAVKVGDKGSVVLFFVVEKDGSISNVKVTRGLAICTSCNEEAKKIIESMPKWEPGMNNGKPVRLYQSLPIRFDFEEED